MDHPPTCNPPGTPSPSCDGKVLTMPNNPQESRCYELRLQGHLGQHWSTWFSGLTLTHEDDGTTTLRGAVIDQAQLHGMLAKIRDLGATLLSVTAAEHHPDPPTRRQDTNSPHRGGAR
jgi:hypothetical protein